MTLQEQLRGLVEKWRRRGYYFKRAGLADWELAKADSIFTCASELDEVLLAQPAPSKSVEKRLKAQGAPSQPVVVRSCPGLLYPDQCCLDIGHLGSCESDYFQKKANETGKPVYVGPDNLKGSSHWKYPKPAPSQPPTEMGHMTTGMVHNEHGETQEYPLHIGSQSQPPATEPGQSEGKK